MGVGIQGKPGGEVTQHSGHCLDVHSILQSQGGEGVPEIVEPDLRQSRSLQHPMEHVQHAVRGDRPARGAGEYPLAAPRFLPLYFQNAYRILCQKQGTVGIFCFQRCLHHLPVDPGELPPDPEHTVLQTRPYT